MAPFRYCVSRHHFTLLLVVFHVGAPPPVSALSVGRALGDVPGWEEAVLDPEGDSPLLKPLGGDNGSAAQGVLRDPRGWEEAVLDPEGDEPLLRPNDVDTFNHPQTNVSVQLDDVSLAHVSRGAGAVNAGSDFPWMLVVVIVLACMLNGLLCCAFRGTQTQGLPRGEQRPPEWPRAKGSGSSLGTKSAFSVTKSRQPPKGPSSGFSESRISSDTECQSEATIEDSAYGMLDQSPIVEAKDIVLCPLLVVPASNRCVCLVNTSASAEKQDQVLQVRGIGGACLFRINVNERSATPPRIQVETVAGDTLAYVCTEPLWRSTGARPPREDGHAPAGAKLQICWPSGRPFGCLRKAGIRAYAVQLDGCEQDVLSFVGDFSHFSISVNTLGMQSVANVSQVSSRECRATVRAHCDAGLVLLVLAAIEKSEVLARGEGVFSAKKPPIESATTAGSGSRATSLGDSGSDPPSACASGTGNPGFDFGKAQSSESTALPSPHSS